MDVNSIVTYVTTNWQTIAILLGAWLYAFSLLAKLTPTQSDDAVVAFLYKAFSVLSIKVQDNPGKVDPPAPTPAPDPAKK